MFEKALRFGKSAPLIGVLTDPARGHDSHERPALILLNAGLLHRVGASRLHVQIARRLAAEGFTSLRFDFSGVGDSEPRRDGLAFEQSAVVETREAMDYLAETRGASRFLLFGLCSGADMAFATARVDERVVGIVQLDAFAYRTWRYYLHYFGPRLLNGRGWLNLVTGRTYVGPFVRRLLGGTTAATARLAQENLVPSPYEREFPPKEHVAQGLRILAARGVRLLNIFSGGQEKHYNHRSQYLSSFRSVPFNGCLRVEYLGAANHTFNKLAHQEFVVDTVSSWVNDLILAEARDRARRPEERKGVA